MGKGNSRHIPDIAVGHEGRLNEVEARIFGFDRLRKDQAPHINLKYIQTEFECFSVWTPDELHDFSNFINKLRQHTWDSVFKSGGKPGTKTGLGMTYMDRDMYPKFPALDALSLDIEFFELRVNEKARVHGFRSVGAFFLVYLDREHRISPS